MTKKIITLVITLAITFMSLLSLASCKKLSYDDIDPSAEIENDVIWNKNNVRISTLRLDFFENRADLVISISNNNSYNISIFCGTVGYCVNSINGYMMSDGYLNVDIPSKTNVHEKISFEYGNLLSFGITQIADIEVGFEIKLENESAETIYTGPLRIKTNIAKNYGYPNTYQEALESGTLERTLDSSLEYFSPKTIYNKNGVHVLSTAIMKASDLVLCIEIKNDSSKEAFVAISDFYVNGILLSDYVTSFERINPHATRIISIAFSSLLQNFKSNYSQIEKIEEMSFLIGEKKTDTPEKVTIQTKSIRLPKELAKS